MDKMRKVVRMVRDVFRYNVTSLWKPLRPKYVLIALTYQCNSRCVMCNIWKMHPKNELTYNEWTRVMKDPIFKDIERLDVTGGEALLLPNASDLISLFVTSMPKLQELSIVSNGFATQRIIDHVTRIANVCKQKNIRFSISISLDGVGETHDAIRRISNGFSLASNTLLKLKNMEKSHHITASSGSLVLRQNLSKVEEMRQWCERKHIPYTFQIVGFHDTYVRNEDTRKTVDFVNTDKQNLEKFLLKESKPKSWRDVRAYYWAICWLCTGMRNAVRLPIRFLKIILRWIHSGTSIIVFLRPPSGIGGLRTALARYISTKKILNGENECGIRFAFILTAGAGWNKEFLVT